MLKKVKDDRWAKELTKQVNALDDDAEGKHAKADNILLEVLRSAGYIKTAKAFEKLRKDVGFWYA